ncbi:MAG TPA: helicase C-terminal domain-containing protein [Gemmatimonadales bacterium]|nr:helicase C-terminal domain-containing protein [Gemmatimonadales bacterium]
MSVERLLPTVRSLVRGEIVAAQGREVSFVAVLDPDGMIVDARVVARGTVDAVLALPGVAARGEMLLHNHPSGVLDPSGADLAVAARLHDAGVGFGIVDNDVLELYVVVECPKARAAHRLDAIAVARLLAEGGAVANALGGFEDRPSQRDMAAYIADVYNDGGIAILEAGTGVGKSFAYLVAALEWARENGERTVVSTNTINLQEQLVGKDLPILARALASGEHQPTFALLKGWRNYVCLSRLEHATGVQESLFEGPRTAELEGLSAWAARTPDGSLADLADPPSDEVWDAVAAESDLCTRLKCPHFERCFVFQARRRAAEADVVVVNHHLLASDLAVRLASDNWLDAAVLPPYRRLVLDEAHHLEDVAAGHLGNHVSQQGILRLLSRLERGGRGLLPALSAELAVRDDLLSAASRDLLQQRLLDGLRGARVAAEDLFTHLARRLDRDAAGAVAPPVLRLTEQFESDPVWAEGLGVALENLLVALSTLRDGVETIAERLSLEDPGDRPTQLIGELRGVVRRLDGAAQGLTAALQPAPSGGAPEGSAVRWLERRGRRGRVGGSNLALAAVPLDLAPILKGALFDRVETVVLTSATLAAGGSFDFLEERLGLALAPSRVRTREILGSPFDFAAQCLFGIPTDVAEPRDDAAGHDEAVVRVLAELAQASDGGVFCLFTSHGQLRRAAAAARSGLSARWPVLVQGEDQRDRLLRRFRESGSAILLGTDSFWEGVDVPGRALRALIIAKLPFRVPSEPLTAARIERLESQGMNGFSHYLLPLAALKLKQGFGRLIRTRADVGAIVLLDRRVVTKRYGAVVLEGLPRATRVVGHWLDVREACEEFFARHGIGAGLATGSTSAEDVS